MAKVRHCGEVDAELTRLCPEVKLMDHEFVEALQALRGRLFAECGLSDDDAWNPDAQIADETPSVRRLYLSLRCTHFLTPSLFECLSRFRSEKPEWSVAVEVPGGAIAVCLDSEYLISGPLFALCGNLSEVIMTGGQARECRPHVRRPSLPKRWTGRP